MNDQAPQSDKPAQIPRFVASKYIQRKVLVAELDDIAESRAARGVDAGPVEQAREALSPRRPAPARGDGSFLGRTAAAWLSWLAGRRDKKDDTPVAPPHCDLVGLALSGGGIRSASVSLGVLQALARANKLRFIDYLSTVSGGGYVGSAWSALLATSRTRDGAAPRQVRSPPDFPFVHRDGEPVEQQRRERGLEPVALVHLRDFANYLMPRGLRDQIRAPALLLRGIIINLLLVLPIVLVSAAITLWYYGDDLALALAGAGVDDLPGLWWTYVLLAVCFGFMVLATAYQKWRTWVARTLERRCPDRIMRRWLALRRSRERQRRRHRERAMPLAILSGLLTLLPIPGREDWRVRGRLLGWGSALFFVLAVVAFFELQQYAVYAFATFDLPDQGGLWGALGTLAGLVSAVLAGKLSDLNSPRVRRAAAISISLAAPLLLWVIFLALCRMPLQEPWIGHRLGALPLVSSWFDLTSGGPDWAWFYLATAAFIWVLSLATVDVNMTSLHNHYRDRLSRAFMLRFEPDGDGWRIRHDDDVLLSECRPTSDTGAPYHLVNAIVNSPNFADESRIGDESQRGRRADFFVFSPRHSGNERLGYCRTEDLEAADPHVNLATAMAISAAAAAPNMGQKTFGPLATFLLAMLNVRLGYWMRTPEAVNDGLFTLPVGPIHFFLELLGLPPRGPRAHINLSDGGHLENLGIFEPLRRRCRYIVAIDAEADPGMSFNGLAVVQRLARTDLDVHIHFDVEDLRTDEDGLSRRHFALCRIDYGDGHEGELLYIKSSLTGTEIEYIKEYHKRNPTFPHESTGDQFFDETQFEAYRALGLEMGTELVANRYADSVAERERQQEESVEGFFRELRSWLRPVAPFHDDFMRLGKSRLDLDLRMHDERQRAFLNEVLYVDLEIANGDAAAAEGGLREPPRPPDWNAATGNGANQVDVHHLQLVNEQLQLMEQAVLALHLNEPRNQEHPRNRGWMNLFRRWSRSRVFRKYWAVSIASYSDMLLVFSKYALRLEFDYDWEEERRPTPAEALFIRNYSHCAVRYGCVAPKPPDADPAADDKELKTCVALALIDRSGNGEAVLRGFRIRRPYRNLRLSEGLLEALPERVRGDAEKPLDWFYDFHDASALDEVTARLKRVLARSGRFRERPPPSTPAAAGGIAASS